MLLASLALFYRYFHKNIRKWRLQKAWQYDLYEAAPLISSIYPTYLSSLSILYSNRFLKLPIDSALITLHANCSSDLTNCMPPLLPQPHCTRLASSSQPYSVHLSNAIVNPYSQSFIPFSGKLWNSLPASVFPPAYDCL